MSGVPRAPLRVALFHGLPPGGALRALYEVVKHFPPDLQVDLFAADLAPVDRWADLGAGTYRLDLPGLVASTRSYKLPHAVRIVGPRLGRISTFVVGGEAMRRVQRQMARDIEADHYDVAFVHACGFSLTVPIAEWLTVPCVFYAGEPRRVGFEAQLPSPVSRGRRRETLVRRLGSPYESVCRRRDRRAVAAADRVLCNSRFTADMLTAAYGIDAVVCYLGVDDNVFSPLKEPPVSTTAPPVSPLQVLSVGALEPLKGHDLALAATARAANAISSRGELHVVYERELSGYASELESLARSLSVDLHLHRGISDDRLVDLYRTARVTVCAARLESFGLTPPRVDELWDARSRGYAGRVSRVRDRRAERISRGARCSVIERWDHSHRAWRFEDDASSVAFSCQPGLELGCSCGADCPPASPGGRQAEERSLVPGERPARARESASAPLPCEDVNL